MRAWILIAVIVLAGCHARRSTMPGSNAGSAAVPQGGPWTQGLPALQGP
jgi:hypothetical protein